MSSFNNHIIHNSWSCWQLLTMHCWSTSVVLCTLCWVFPQTWNAQVSMFFDSNNCASTQHILCNLLISWWNVCLRNMGRCSVSIGIYVKISWRLYRVVLVLYDSAATTSWVFGLVFFCSVVPCFFWLVVKGIFLNCWMFILMASRIYKLWHWWAPVFLKCSAAKLTWQVSLSGCGIWVVTYQPIFDVSSSLYGQSFVILLKGTLQFASKSSATTENSFFSAVLIIFTTTTVW